MTSHTQLKAWLESASSELVTALTADIQRHVSTLDSGEPFYGYAVLPGDYTTEPNPAFRIAFNRESDIAPENLDNLYYRYSVDEWKNYIDDQFEDTNSKLQSQLEKFKVLHTPSDNIQMDEYEIALIEKISNATLDALTELRRNGTFNNKTFLAIWFSDSESKIMCDAVKALNPSDVYEQFAAEFQ